MFECSPLTLELPHYLLELQIMVITPSKKKEKIHGVIYNNADISHAEDSLLSNHSLYGNNIHQDYFIERIGHCSFDLTI
jgi:hypothetical protein